MKIDIHIAEQYADNKCLAELIDGLPSSFEDGGVMLWDGRNKVKALRLADGHEVVVKRFKHLLLVQRIGYLFHKHKAYRAFANGQELVRRGISTPAPVACIEYRKLHLIDDAYYICERNDNPPIEDLIYRDDWDPTIATAFARYAAQLHQKGVLHHDLNDTNVRYVLNDKNEYEFSVIDINRMAFYDRLDDIPMKERIENLCRFTSRIDLFEFVAREYAQQMGLDVEAWLPIAINQKKRHDSNRRRRKRLVHPIRTWKMNHKSVSAS